jgi:2-iminobutanoate/2-iminopropanoate deaminase
MIPLTENNASLIVVEEILAMGKTAYNPAAMNPPFGIFSNAALAGPGQLYYISGQVAVDAEGKLVG